MALLNLTPKQPTPNWKIMLMVATVFQLVFWIISFVDYTLGIFDTIIPGKDSIGLVGSILIICFSIFVIWSNIYLLFGKRESLIHKNLIFNKWLNLIQIFHVSVLGIYFSLIIGVQVEGVYLYTDAQRLLFTSGFHILELRAGYDASNTIAVGINLIPIFLFFIFKRCLERKRIVADNISDSIFTRSGI